MQDTAETVSQNSTIPPSMPYISTGTKIQQSQNPRSTPSNSNSTDVSSSDPLEHHPKQTTHTIIAPPLSLPLDTQPTMDISPNTTSVEEPSSGTEIALVPETFPQTSETGGTSHSVANNRSLASSRATEGLFALLTAYEGATSAAKAFPSTFTFLPPNVVRVSLNKTALFSYVGMRIVHSMYILHFLSP